MSPGGGSILSDCRAASTSVYACRLERPAADVLATITARPTASDFADLFKSDQLSTLLRAPTLHPIQSFRELCPPPSRCPPFPPTYKLLPGTDDYDARRTPSWTDRILWRCNYLLDTGEGPSGPSPVTQLSYTSLHDVRQSDHRPVVAAFAVALKHTAPLLLDESVDTAAAYQRGRSLRRWLMSSRVPPAQSAPLPASPGVPGPLCANAAALALEG
jgi:hypothetical protein